MSSGFSNMSEAASQIAGQASELGKETMDRLDANRGAMADGLERTADAIRSNAPASSGMAQSLANALGNAAGYVRSRDVRSMGSDLTDAVRRNPGPSLFAALATGFLVAVIMKRSGRSSGDSFHE